MQRAEHQDLKNLCQNIITSQQQEIQQMQTWLAQWYNIRANAAQATPAASATTEANATTTPTANTTTTLEANATATPSTSAPTTLPETGGTFDVSVLPIVIGLILLGAGLFVFRMRGQAR
ncbi:MAG TPA: LPXTG cell wall anchor domain-containing protein [Anaerolineae bacterium]|nr:LPXTG cell wall anchor domain-containing protein [Anaerolineae bacterium]